MADLSEKEIVELKENEEIKTINLNILIGSDNIEDDIDQAKENGFYWQELEDFGPEDFGLLDFGLGERVGKDKKEKKDEKDEKDKKEEDDEYFNDFQDVEMYEHIALQVFA
jgi:hypothetical protein